MDASAASGATDPALAPDPAPAPIPTRRGTGLTATERIRRRLTAFVTRVGPRLFAIDGVLVVIVGVYAVFGSVGTFQGEGFLLVVGGSALVLFGLMMILRWNLAAVRTGLIGLTAGYFASALSEFQVATDPCDIGAKLARCVGDPVLGTPWIVYQGPLILATLLFVFIALEPFLAAPSASSPTPAATEPLVPR